MKLTIILLAVVLGLLRPVFVFRTFNHHISQSYQAVAHILVGALFATWWLTGGPWALWTVVALSVVEVVCAVISFARKHEIQPGRKHV